MLITLSHLGSLTGVPVSHVDFKKIAKSLDAIIANSMSIYKEEGLTPHVELPVSCMYIDFFLTCFLF